MHKLKHKLKLCFSTVSRGSNYSSNLIRGISLHITLIEPFHAACNCNIILITIHNARNCRFISEKFTSTSVGWGTLHTLPHRGLRPLIVPSPRSEHLPTPNRHYQPCDVVLRVLVSSRLEDKNECLGIGSWSLGLEHLVLVLKKKSCSFSCCNSWRQWARHTMAFCERQQSLPSHCLREHSALHAQPQLRGYLTMGGGLFVRPHRRQ